MVEYWFWELGYWNPKPFSRIEPLVFPKVVLVLSPVALCEDFESIVINNPLPNLKYF